MGDIADTVQDAVEKAKESKLNSIVAVCVAVSATFMALCNVKDGNIVQAMQQAQAKSVDTWSFYQAKSTKQHLAEQMADQLILQRDLAGPSLSEETSKLYAKKIAEYQAKVKAYDAEKEDIKKQAEDLEKQYDALNVHDDQFDMAEATISISIALFGVTALTQKRPMLLFGGAFSLTGIVLGLAGFLGWNLHPDWLAKLLS